MPAPEEPARRPSQRIGGPVDAPPRSTALQAPVEAERGPAKAGLAAEEHVARGERFLGACYLAHAGTAVLGAAMQRSNPALALPEGGAAGGPCATVFWLVLGLLLLANRGRVLTLVINGLLTALVLFAGLIGGALVDGMGGAAVAMAVAALLNLTLVVGLLTRPVFRGQHVVALCGQGLLVATSLFLTLRPQALLELSGMVVPVQRGTIKAKAWRLKVDKGWYRLRLGGPPADKGDLLMKFPSGALVVLNHQPLDPRTARRLQVEELLAQQVSALSTKITGFDRSPTRLQPRPNQRATAFKGNFQGKPTRGELLVTLGLEGFLVAFAHAPEPVWPSLEAEARAVLSSVELDLEPMDISDLLGKPVGGGPGGPAAPAVDWGNPAVVLERAASDDVAVRVEALEQWLARSHHKAPGARLAMLRALHSPRLTSDAEPAVARAFDDPIQCREALDCVPLVPPRLRDRLMRRLAEPDGTAPEAELAAALAQLPDTKELFIEESLAKLGHPREGALQRLVDARGTEWARSADGRALLRRLPDAEVTGLFAAAREELRMLGVLLVADRGGDLALDRLVQAILDPSPAVRQEAASALERLQDPRMVMLLVRSYRLDQDEGTRARLRRALAAIALQDAVQALADHLAAEDVEARLDAVAGLELLPSPVGVLALSKALLDQDAAVRQAALRALASLRTSRVQGVADTLFASASDELRRVALESPDEELKKAARHLYFQVRGRLPEQDDVAARPRAGAGVAGAGTPPAERARPQVVWTDGGWQGTPDPRYAFEADPRLAEHPLEPRFRATVQAVNRLRGSTVELVGLRAWVEVRGAQGWKMEERPFELELTPQQRVVTALGGGRFRVEDVRRTLRLDLPAFQQKVKDAVQGAIRNVRIREQGGRR